jgi:hypothetical protein
MSDRAFTTVGDRLITEGNLIELNSLHLKGMQLREQMEAMAARCSQILGVEDLEGSVCKDYAEEIVYAGTAPMEAIKNLRDCC